MSRTEIGQSAVLGIRYMVISAIGFSLMAVCVKAVSNSGIPLFEIIAARALISLSLSYVLVSKKGISIWGNNKFLLACRGIVGALALICVYGALTVLPLAEATIIQNVTPIITSVMAFLFLKEKVHTSTMISLLLSVIGVVVIVKPDLFMAPDAMDLPIVGVVIALIGALGSSIAYTIVRKLSGTEDPSVIVFYFPLFALPVSLVLLGSDFVMPNLYQFVLLVLVGVLTQVGQVYLTKAMKVGSASKTMVYSYLQVVFAIVFGVLFFDEIPTWTTLLGTVFIIGGALLNLFKRPA
ncbi:DMT family transporter [Thaumasiovibrio subtropicus]|uniref:DMT family transporter n=1 Tax=Thaumasiovibrio subtropicus TaxID=1891207 RepID=UPI00192CFBCE|nr:DMT family transporter [Thaumasiovibrio subtropicus]